MVLLKSPPLLGGGVMSVGSWPAGGEGGGGGTEEAREAASSEEEVVEVEVSAGGAPGRTPSRTRSCRENRGALVG
jgi:hypothetical protein